MDEKVDALRKSIAALEKRAETLEKRYDRIVGRADEFVPKTTAIMREGIPLEIFTRLALINNNFEVFGIYPYEYISRERDTIERSVDVYAVRDSVYSADGGVPLPERNHLLVEAKQRRPGVEWIFSTLPQSRKDWSIAGDSIPIANSGFELRPTESGLSNSGNPKDVVNAISQLNEAYMPFTLGLRQGASIETPGSSRKYSANRGHEYVWLLLVTNAKLKYFTPPEHFHEVGISAEQEHGLFKEVPWVAFRPEASLSLRYHQEHTIQRSGVRHTMKPDSVERLVIDAEKEHTHEVHIVRYDHLSAFVALVNDPPRMKSIQFSLSVNGGPATNFTVGPR
jgi:hypothetical protein